MDNLITARVILEHKERYILISEFGELEAQVTGKLRFTANSPSDFPSVGDHVAISIAGDNLAIIHEVLPRKSFLARKMVGSNEMQVIAANIDIAFITTAVDRDFNLNRIERFLTIARSGNVEPVVLLTKTDLIDEEELNAIVESIEKSHPGVPVYALSNISGKGIEEFSSRLEKDKTYCFLGSSGVGKSTLINSISNNYLQKTLSISDSTGKGRHTTTSRQMIILEKGILIDTPGLREIGITAEKSGIENTFSQLMELAAQCRYSDCTHTGEKGCAVLKAVEMNELDARTLESYRKLEKERRHLETSHADKRKNEKKFGKMAKQILSEKKKSKY